MEEARAGTLLFDVQVNKLSDLDYHTLGAIIGSKSGANIPVIKGLLSSVTNDQLKCLGAAAASAGSVALYHVLGITPEAILKDPFHGRKPHDVITITRSNIQEMEDHISTADTNDRIDMVALGCPLLSIEELKVISQKMQNRRVKEHIHFWIYLTQETYDLSKILGLVDPLEKAGVWFSTQTCATISPVKTWGFSNVMTNSAKCALIVPSEHTFKITYKDTDVCILSATQPT